MKKPNLKGKEVRKSERRKIKKLEGFTFVETLAVIAISAVLTAGSTVSVTKLINLAKRTSARNQIDQLSAGMQSYFLDCGQFPTTEQGINALWECPELYPVPDNWNGPYLEKKPGPDPWGSSFKYYNAQTSIMPSSVPENLPYILISYGADGKEGGEGNGEDILSWE